MFTPLGFRGTETLSGTRRLLVIPASLLYRSQGHSSHRQCAHLVSQTALPVPVPLLWGLWAWTLFTLAQPLLYFSTAVCLFQREKICWSQWSPSYPPASLSVPPAVCWMIVLELYINSKQTYTLQSPMAKMLGSHLALARFLTGEDCVCLGIPTKAAGAWQVSKARTPQWTLLSPLLLSKFF